MQINPPFLQIMEKNFFFFGRKIYDIWSRGIYDSSIKMRKRCHGCQCRISRLNPRTLAIHPSHIRCSCPPCVQRVKQQCELHTSDVYKQLEWSHLRAQSCSCECANIGRVLFSRFVTATNRFSNLNTQKRSDGEQQQQAASSARGLSATKTASVFVRTFSTRKCP